jgi:tetratricopeptide (TPR) repeat protein
MLRGLLAVSLLVAGSASAQAPIRLIEAVEANEQNDHVNITALFACSMRYVSHLPVSRGDTVRIQLRLGADCQAGFSSLAPESPLVGGSSNLVRSVRLEGTALGAAVLEMRWARPFDFVLAPTTNGRGIRVRLLNVTGLGGRVIVGNVDEAPDGYSVNLASSQEPFIESAVKNAAAQLRVPVYVSEVDLDGVRWYRLRAGPFATRRDADRVLLSARSLYGRAWLGINDEEGVTSPEGSRVVPLNIDRPVDPAMTPAARDALQSEARTAFTRRNHAQAIELFTKLLRQPEFPQRAADQELLGLARERSSQLAQAKAEYEEYLRRYPDGAAAGRIRSRLRILASSGKSLRGLGVASDGKPLGWSNTGVASELYQYGKQHTDVGGLASDRTNVSVSLTDADWLARFHGERFDFSSRTSVGYTKDLLAANNDKATRVAALYAEFTDRQLGLSGRIGRQSHSGDGILGLFDGVLTSWQRNSRWAYTAAIGFPTETTRNGFSNERRFIAVSAHLGPLRGAWDLGTYLIDQQLDGRLDRQALGFETRYFVPGRTSVLLVDFDLHYSSLNSAILMGNWLLPDKWSLSYDLSHRRNPILMTRNALIGQPVSNFTALESLFTTAEITRLALDRTSVSDSVAVAISRAIGEKWQFMADAFGMRIGASPASGGVPAVPDSGWDRSFQLQLSGASLWGNSDLHFFSVRAQQSLDARSYSVGWSARFPMISAWRIGPVLRAEQRERFTDQSTQSVYTPELRIDYTSQHAAVDLNFGGEFSKRELPADLEKIRRFYVLASYRYRF